MRTIEPHFLHSSFSQLSPEIKFKQTNLTLGAQSETTILFWMYYIGPLRQVLSTPIIIIVTLSLY